MITQRPRRNRKNETIRSMVQETQLSTANLIAPLFLIDGKNIKTPINSMPGQFRFSLDNVLKEIKELVDLGINSVSLFPVVEDKLKTPDGKISCQQDFYYLKAIHEIKSKFPELVIMTDVALDPYSSDGHDGIVCSKTGKILNDPTLEILSNMALAQAKAGSDIIGPSDMMDGRIQAIRTVLDSHKFSETSIMAYTAKYASSFYGPFREALDSAPKKGDKKTYQMDFHNSNEALIEASLDEKEGADFIMVKPGLAYLDIICQIRKKTNLPIAAYNVSGEYAMVMAASEKGWIDADKIIYETLIAFRRAGANVILTYFAKRFAEKFS